MLLNDNDRKELLKVALLQTRSHITPTGEWVRGYRDIYEALGMSKVDKNARILPSDERRLTVNYVHWHLKAKVNYDHKSSAHRLFIQCPCCDKMIPAGRLRQHAHIHQES